MRECEILFLNRNEIESVLTMKIVVETCDDVIKWIGEEKVEQKHVTPIRYFFEERKRSIALPHPAFVKPLNVIGNKWGGGSDVNFEKGLPWGTAEITLNDPITMHPFAIMDGTEITTLRTAGHAAIGAKYLARKDSEIFSIIGCGYIGQSHLSAMNEIFKIKEVKVFDIKKEKAKEYSEVMGKKLNLNIKLFDSPQEAVKHADIICMGTTSMEPVILEEWIEPGCHVAAIYAFIDLDQKFSKKADKWVLGNWERDSDWIEKPSVPWVHALDKKDVYADLSEIAVGRKPGREKTTERTVVTHLGMGAFDVAVGYQAYKLAVEKGLGVKLKLF
jgi:ornithine cyclodeaminase/alanine dehydrogenase-like protein (mu-crystallin family)